MLSNLTRQPRHDLNSFHSFVMTERNQPPSDGTLSPVMEDLKVISLVGSRRTQDLIPHTSRVAQIPRVGNPLTLSHYDTAEGTVIGAPPISRFSTLVSVFSPVKPPRKMELGKCV